MFAGLIIAISFFVFVISAIIVGGNLFPFEWNAVKIGLGLCALSAFVCVTSLWCARD